MGFGTTCGKIFLNVINVLWIIGSFFMISVAANIKNAPDWLVALIWILVLFVFVTAVVGCAAISLEHPMMTKIYAILICACCILDFLMILNMNVNSHPETLLRPFIMVLMLAVAFRLWLEFEKKKREPSHAVAMSGAI